MKYISNLPSSDYCSYFYQENTLLAKKKRVLSICGSTGSIGVSTLKIVAAYPELFEVFALAGGKNIQLLAEQAVEFQPKVLVIKDEADIPLLKKILSELTNKPYSAEILFGQEGYEFIARHEEVTTFVSAQVGAAGLRSTLAAAERGKVICLANKESLVLAGNLLRETCEKTNACILPVDSEHHALFQCLQGHNTKDVKKLMLTASGGALRDKDYEFLKSAKAADALKHPNWSMGAKITIDSATLMNKGLEVIEACHLYGMDLSLVDVVIHPQSIIHSLVEYKDNSFMAQLSVPSMLLPIAHCLAYPYTLDADKYSMPELDMKKLASLTFNEVDNQKFPCLELAKQAYKENKCVALNAANEIVVDAFLENKITFLQIPQLIESVLEKANVDMMNIDEILHADALYRVQTKEKLENIKVK